MKKMTALIILDGFGIREESKYNAVKADGVKNITKLWNEYPHTQIGRKRPCRRPAGRANGQQRGWPP